MTERPTWTRDVETTADELLDMIRRPSWWHRAACLGVGVDIFIGHKGDDTSPAMAYCSRCPVTEECATWAAAYPGSVGVWGGISGNRRRSFRSLNRRCQICGSPITERRRVSLCSADCEAESKRRSQRASHQRRGVAR